MKPLHCKTLYLIFLSFLILTQTNALAGYNEKNERTCTKTAKFLKYSCGFEVRDDYLASIAVCLNKSDDDEQRNCLREGRIAQREANQECRQVFRARKEVCNAVGEAPYDPPFGEEYAANFVDPLEIGKSVIPNPYFPLVQGNSWIYEGTSINDEGEEEIERIELKVTNKTKLIEGITCVVVNDIVTIGGEIVEDTDDWYAQDTQGNLWYAGEIVLNFETFEGDDPTEAEITDIGGSWKSGRDGARAGVSVPFAPVVGELIRQEIFWDEAEDVIEVLDVNATETSPAASCNGNCLRTYDFTPLDAEANENKYYAPGIGLIVEIDLNTGDRVELIEFTSN